MDGETNGGQEATQGAQDTSQQQGQEQQETQQQGQPQVGGNETDFEKQIAERDEKIAVLEAQVAEAAKNAETAEQLRGEIAELKAQGESDWIDFGLQLAGVRNVKAARALLSDHDNDVDKLKEAEPWLFEAGVKHTKGGNAGGSGTTGLPNAGAASDEGKTLKHWRESAGLTDDDKKEQDMPSNNIAFARNYTSVIDEVYQRASVSGVLNSGRRMVRAGHNAKEILIPKISVTGLGDYTRNVGYKTGAITYEFETKTFNYDRGIRLFADVMDVEEAGVNDCFVEAGAELQRTQVTPESDAFAFAQIASHTGVTVTPEGLSDAEATDILQALRTVTSAMDENQVTLGSLYLFITPTLKDVLDDYSYANPTMSNRVLERFARVIEVPQVRFYTAIDLKSGDTEFGYAKASAGEDINFMVLEKSTVIKFDKHVASRVSPLPLLLVHEPR